MRKACVILLFVFVSSNCWSQAQFEENVYLMFHLGSGVFLTQPTIPANNYSIDFVWEKISTFVGIRDNLGLHLLIQGIRYAHDIKTNYIASNNYGFNVLGDQHLFYNHKMSILAGISYKFNYKRFIVMPFFDVGCIPFVKSSNNIYFVLKEQNSNNIRKITYQFSTNPTRFDYAFGADLCFHFKRWGLSSSFQFDRFKTICDGQLITTDYYSDNKIENYRVDFRNLSLLYSLGLFFSF